LQSATMRRDLFGHLVRVSFWWNFNKKRIWREQGPNQWNKAKFKRVCTKWKKTN